MTGGTMIRRPRAALRLAISMVLLVAACAAAWLTGLGQIAAPAAAAPPAAPYREALEPRAWSFPRDHGAHPDYQTEWWYYTGHLEGDDGHRYGFQLVFFRRGPDPALDLPPGFEGWSGATFYPAHFAITEIAGKRFHHEQRIQRDLGRAAGADTVGLNVWCGDWRARRFGDAQELAARSETWRLRLFVTPLTPPVLHGLEGLSRKGPHPGQASHYYSLPRMTAAGEITKSGRLIRVRGEAWMDHEFFSSDLDTTLAGWDWFSLQFDDRTELMLYRLRGKAGPLTDELSGTFIDADGQPTPLGRDDFLVEPTATWTSPATAITYPAAWKITVPRLEMTLTAHPSVADQELDTRGSTGVVYWEGSINVAGSRARRPLTGAGYAELTGYDGHVPMSRP